MKVKVLSNINSGEFLAGSVVDFPDEQANELIEAGAVKLFDPETDVASTESADVSQPDQPAGEAQEALPPEVPLAPPEPAPVAQAPAKASQAPSPTAEQIAQDVASTESKSEV